MAAASYLDAFGGGHYRSFHEHIECIPPEDEFRLCAIFVWNIGPETRYVVLCISASSLSRSRFITKQRNFRWVTRLVALSLHANCATFFT